MSGPLDGRSALITGANQGLGLAIARAYVEAGASVLICARDAATARASAGRAGGAGRDQASVVTGQAADVSTPRTMSATRQARR